MAQQQPDGPRVIPFELVDPRLGRPHEVSVVHGARSYLNVSIATLAGWRPIKVDVHLPAGHAGPHPVVVYAHGGAFLGGVKEMGPWGALPDAGIAVVSVDYRLSGEVRFPGPVEDIQSAVRWVRSPAAAPFSLDAHRVAAWGSSAGGYLVGLAALLQGRFVGQPPPPELAGVSATLDAVVLHYPIVDFEELRKLHLSEAVQLARVEDSISRLFGSSKGALPADSSMLQLARRAATPPAFQLFHGDGDTVVSCEQSRLLHETVRMAGGTSEFKLVAGEDHATSAFASPTVVDETIRFLNTHWAG